MPLLGRPLQQGHQDLHLGRRGGGALLDQCGINGQLAQAGQGGEHLHLVVLQVLGKPEDALALTLEVAVVDVAVCGDEFHVEDLFLLGRQVQGHVLLGATQQERGDAAAQAGHELPIRVIPVLQRPAVGLPELGRRAQQARCRQGEHRPQFPQVVLHRCARDGEEHGSQDLLHRGEGARVVVLGVVGLVEHQAHHTQVGVVLLLQSQQRVGGDDHVRPTRRVGEVRPPPRPRGLDGDDPQVRCEAPGLGHPVGHHGGRGDHQPRAPVAGSGALPRPLGPVLPADEGGAVPFPLVENHGEHLQGLAQPHVIGEHTAESGATQSCQPLEALTLVGTQCRMQAGGKCCRLGRLRHGIADCLEPGVFAGVHDAQCQELLPPGQAHLRHPQGGTSLVGQLRRLRQEAAEVVQGRVVQVGVGPVGEEEDLLTEGQGTYQGGHGNLRSAHLDVHVQVEPVGTLRSDLDAHQRRAGIAQLGQVVAQHGHTQRLEAREDLIHQAHHLHATQARILTGTHPGGDACRTSGRAGGAVRCAHRRSGSKARTSGGGRILLDGALQSDQQVADLGEQADLGVALVDRETVPALDAHALALIPGAHPGPVQASPRARHHTGGRLRSDVQLQRGRCRRGGGEAAVRGEPARPLQAWEDLALEGTALR